jgi:tRNA-specific 2-thiouridylase
MTKKKVYVGLSGGVDSSLTAALLKEHGYDVTGVYMKNWSKDLPGFECPWKQDYLDAKRVAAKLDIPFKMYDFETKYKQKVVDYMIDGYKKGITPNPDIMCNQEIKFKLFLETALSDGAELIATGHYARIKNNNLLTAKDKTKDQTYFLYRMPQEALKVTIMPIGDYLKTDVRKLAKKYGLPTADKPDSQGICFIGEVGVKEFLTYELGIQKPGNILDEKGLIVGQHDGAIYYTIGQRHGLDVGGGLPYYVTGKDIKKNEVYVTTDLNSKNLWSDKLHLVNFYLTSKPTNKNLKVRTRYRAPLVDCTLEVKGDKAVVSTKSPIRAIAPGQSAVLYDGDICVGGGILI